MADSIIPATPLPRPNFPQNPVVGTSPGGQGVLGESNTGDGVHGEITGGFGVLRDSPQGFAAVHGNGGKNGVWGYTVSANDAGVFGSNDGSGNGVTGYSKSGGSGVRGDSPQGFAAVHGNGGKWRVGLYRQCQRRRCLRFKRWQRQTV